MGGLEESTGEGAAKVGGIYIYHIFCDYESLLAPQLIHQADHFGAYDQYALLHLGAPPLTPVSPDDAGKGVSICCSSVYKICIL